MPPRTESRCCTSTATDSHVYRSDNPLEENSTCHTETDPCTADAWLQHPYYNVPNFHRIVVHGSTFPLEWLKVSIDPRAAWENVATPISWGPFSWRRETQSQLTPSRLRGRLPRTRKSHLLSGLCSKLRMVEAAGVEPASESTPSQESTCVAALESSRPPSKCDGNRQPLAPMDLAVARRNRQQRPAFCYDIRPRPEGEDVGDVATY